MSEASVVGMQANVGWVVVLNVGAHTVRDDCMRAEQSRYLP